MSRAPGLSALPRSFAPAPHGLSCPLSQPIGPLPSHPANQAAALLQSTEVAPGLHRLQVDCRVAGIVPPPAVLDLRVRRTGSTWSVWATGPDGAQTRSWLAHAFGLHQPRLEQTGSLQAYTGTSHGPPPRIVLAAVAARVEHLQATPDGVIFLVRGGPAALHDIGQALRGPVAAEGAAKLTARQDELLRFCVSRGYYAIPRRMTLRMLAAELLISTTSLSLALRRAEAKLVLHHVTHVPAQAGAIALPTIPPAGAPPAG